MTRTHRHHRPTSLLAAVALCVGWAAAVAAQGSAATDRAALEALYDATGGPGWTENTNWKTSAPLGEWYGVWTDAGGRVTSVVLDANGLNGEIPAELGNLVNLVDLLLSHNDLMGSVPASLGNLTRLKALWVANNALTGPIPSELGSLVNLVSLFLHRNRLDGPIPAELGNLRQLWDLRLQQNNFTGPIPAELGSLVNLQNLNLYSNALTGPIPDELRSLVNLRLLYLHHNDLTGPIPNWLGAFSGLQSLLLRNNALTGPIPSELARLTNLEVLDLSGNWGLSGPLPIDLPLPRYLNFFLTQACGPVAWRDRLRTLDYFNGRLCEEEMNTTIDVAVVYTPAARETAGGAAALEAEIDLLIAETNQVYEASGVRHRLALVERSEVAYTETSNSRLDLDRLSNPSDGHMDEVHALRDRTGADLVHLVTGGANGGLAMLVGPFSMMSFFPDHATLIFAHELGHNMGLRHDRYSQLYSELHRGPVRSNPAFGYVNQRAFESDAPHSSRWFTMMAYDTQCDDAGFICSSLLRFSNPRQSYNGDPLGIPYGEGEPGRTGPSDAAAVLNVTGPVVASWRDRPGHRPPTTVGTLPDRGLGLHGTLTVDVSHAFVDPDGDALTYGVSSSAPHVVTVRAAGAWVTLTAVSEGTATIRVTATDPGGLSAVQVFTVTVDETLRVPFTDDPIVPGVTPIKEVHFTELRTRIDALRNAAGLARFSWTDPVLRVGVTSVKLVHLLELRSALGAAYGASGRAAPRWTDLALAAGTTPILAAHLTELRAAVLGLE